MLAPVCLLIIFKSQIIAYNMCPIYFLKVFGLLLFILEWQFSDKSADKENVSYHLGLIEAGKPRLREGRIWVNPDLDLAV